MYSIPKKGDKSPLFVIDEMEKLEIKRNDYLNEPPAKKKRDRKLEPVSVFHTSKLLA